MALINFPQYFCIIFLLMSKIIFIPAASLHDISMSKRHESWMAQHGRVYKDASEKMKRLEIFKDNVQKIEAFNSGPDKGYKLGINAFADMTIEEIRSSRTGHKTHNTKITSPSDFRYANMAHVPKTMDWREKGAVTSVKDQGTCGSCWAFSTVAAMEGIHQIKTGKLVSLSEQELMDCDRRNDDGCHGGNMNDAFEFITQNNGLAKESDYPYTGLDDNKCKAKIAAAAKITGYEQVPANNETALLLAVAHQPVSVAVDSESFEFKNYLSGVLSGECGTNLDHEITAIGYGETSDGVKYWLVKNSWGEQAWGEKGYGMIKRGVAEKEGMCGIAMYASYPTLDI